MPSNPSTIDLTPINLLSEKDKCQDDPNYNPQFNYESPIDPKVLTFWGEPKLEFIKAAKKIIEKYSALNHDKTKPDPEINEEYIRSKVNNFLDKNGITTFSVKFNSRQVARCGVSSNTISFKKNLSLDASNFEGLFRHEIETHVLRRYNHFTNFPERKISSNYRHTEEGLAAYHTYLGHHLSPLLYRSAIRYLATDLSLRESFVTVRKFLEESGIPSHKAILIAIRAKRGLTDLSKPGANTRDIVYLEGAAMVGQWLQDPLHDVRQLYVGRLNIDEASDIQWQNFPQTIFPSFIESPTYRQRVQEIYEYNMLSEINV